MVSELLQMLAQPLVLRGNRGSNVYTAAHGAGGLYVVRQPVVSRTAPFPGRGATGLPLTGMQTRSKDPYINDNN